MRTRPTRATVTRPLTKRPAVKKAATKKPATTELPTLSSVVQARQAAEERRATDPSTRDTVRVKVYLVEVRMHERDVRDFEDEAMSDLKRSCREVTIIDSGYVDEPEAKKAVAAPARKFTSVVRSDDEDDEDVDDL